MAASQSLRDFGCPSGSISNGSTVVVSDLSWVFSGDIARRVYSRILLRVVWGDGEAEGMAPNEWIRARIEAIGTQMQYGLGVPKCWPGGRLAMPYSISRIWTLYFYTVFIMHQPTTVSGKPEFYCSRDTTDTSIRKIRILEAMITALSKKWNSSGFPFLSTCGSNTRLKVLRSEHPGQTIRQWTLQ